MKIQKNISLASAVMTVCALSFLGYWVIPVYAGLSNVKPSPAASSSVAAKAQETDAQEVSPVQPGAVTGEKITPQIAAELFKEFKRAQWNQITAFNHEYRLRLKDQKRVDKGREKEWKEKENNLRRKYFAEHPKGDERRSYMKALIERKKGFEKELSQGLLNFKHETDQKRDELKAYQKAKADEFKVWIAKLQRPPAELWPNTESKHP